MKETFTITIYTENNTGLLIRITSMFVRRRIPIDSLNVTASEVEGVHRFTIVINETEEVTRKLMLQIDKQVDVFKTYFNRNSDVVWQQQVLYKVVEKFTNETVARDLSRFGARRIEKGSDYAVYEVTGPEETTAAVEKALEPLGITEVAKSARIAIIKTENDIHKKVKQLSSLQPTVAEVENDFV